MEISSAPAGTPSMTPLPLISGTPPSPSRTAAESAVYKTASTWTPPRLSSAVVTIQDYVDVEDTRHMAKSVDDPMDSWLPITESRNGNAFYSAFHILCSGIGLQILLLPLAFVYLGWMWGIICLTVVFFWQLYTLWILIRLHESSIHGVRRRCSRYLHLCILAFGPKLGTGLAKFPIMYLSGGTCTTLIIIGGGSLKLFYEIVSSYSTPTSSNPPQPTGIEWYLVFVCLAAIISQLPNMNSLAGVSLVGAVTAISYCTITWVLSISKGRPNGVTFDPATVKWKTDVNHILSVLNGFGIIAFAFRGHNLVLEIQAAMPSGPNTNPSYVPMWRGVATAYVIIALCLFPISIVGYWSYGDMMPHNGILAALHKFHGTEITRPVFGLITLLITVHCLCSFQIYSMPVLDTLESTYTSKHNHACPRWVRSSIRVFFVGFTFFISVAFPFLLDLAGLLGGVALPVTLAYPCFMWALIMKPKKGSSMWYLNWGLGVIGMAFSVMLICSGLFNLVNTGISLRFFKAWDNTIF